MVGVVVAAARAIVVIGIVVGKVVGNAAVGDDAIDIVIGISTSWTSRQISSGTRSLVEKCIDSRGWIARI